ATRRADRRRCSSRCETGRSCSGTRRRRRLRRAAASSSDSLLRLGLELVADAEARVDERVARRRAVDLLAQPPHEDIDRAIAVRLPATPHLLQELVAGHDAPAVERERVQQLELRGRETRAPALDERLYLARVDPQLLDLDRVATPLLRRPDAATRRRADTCDQLTHRERLDEVVVGADLERVDAIVLRPAGRHDHD